MPEITHVCQDCGTKFAVPQGSRRQYCDKCAFKRILAGRKKENKK